MLSMELPLLLNTNIFIERNKIIINYSIENKSDKLVYLTNLNVSYDKYKGPVPDSSVVIILIENDVIHISKRRPIPPSDRFYTPQPYYVTPLKPGSTFTEKVSLKIPLEIKQSKGNNEEEINIKYFSKILFSCGYIIENDYIEHKQKVVDGNIVYYIAASDKIKNLQPGETVPALEELFIQSEMFEFKDPVQVEIIKSD